MKKQIFVSRVLKSKRKTEQIVYGITIPKRFQKELKDVEYVKVFLEKIKFMKQRADKK